MESAAVSIGFRFQVLDCYTVAMEKLRGCLAVAAMYQATTKGREITMSKIVVLSIDAAADLFLFDGNWSDVRNVSAKNTKVMAATMRAEYAAKRAAEGR